MAIHKIDYDQLLNQARVKLIGASDGGLKGELYDVLTEFFNDSSSWTQDVTVPYLPNTQAYPVAVPEGQIIRLVGVSDWGQTVPPIPRVPNPNVSFVPALMPSIGTLVLQQAPNISGYYSVNVVTNVSLPTDRNQMPHGPDWVLPVWHLGILDGLLGKMMTQPGKSYANDKMGTYHLRRFRDAIARARISKLRANTNGAAAWRFPQQFRSTSQQSGVPAIGSASERSF
jgi:hypothetical protein